MTNMAAAMIRMISRAAARKINCRLFFMPRHHPFRIHRFYGRGRVLLSTEEIGGFIRITILDNGYGYKELTEKENRSKGIGIENTKERLETLCRGSLSISSDGAGTKAVIFIPKMEA